MSMRDVIVPGHRSGLVREEVEGMLAGNQPRTPTLTKDPSDAAPELLSVAETARFLAKHPNWIYRRAGEIPGVVRFRDGRIFFKRRVLERWLNGEAAA